MRETTCKWDVECKQELVGKGGREREQEGGIERLDDEEKEV